VRRAPSNTVLGKSGCTTLWLLWWKEGSLDFSSQSCGGSESGPRREVAKTTKVTLNQSEENFEKAPIAL